MIHDQIIDGLVCFFLLVCQLDHLILNYFLSALVVLIIVTIIIRILFLSRFSSIMNILDSLIKSLPILSKSIARLVNKHLHLLLLPISHPLPLLLLHQLAFSPFPFSLSFLSDVDHVLELVLGRTA